MRCLLEPTSNGSCVCSLCGREINEEVDCSKIHIRCKLAKEQESVPYLYCIYREGSGRKVKVECGRKGRERWEPTYKCKLFKICVVGVKIENEEERRLIKLCDTCPKRDPGITK